jgi:hypothetical protein
MNQIDDLKENIIILEDIIKTVAGCPHCSGCKSLSDSYLKTKELFDGPSKS